MAGPHAVYDFLHRTNRAGMDGENASQGTHDAQRDCNG